jgi:hypothetical protein
LNHEEFKHVAEKCVKNDTSNIDYLICGGVYYHSDGFDSFVLAPFGIIHILKSHKPPWFDILYKAWNNYVNQIITKFTRGLGQENANKLPVLDLEFERNGITYVKPAPPLGRSLFWPDGKRPRENTSGIEKCPHVGVPFPKISQISWQMLKKKISDDCYLQDSYQDWLEFSKREDERHSDFLKPLVPMGISDSFVKDVISNTKELFFIDLCQKANLLFSESAIRLSRTASAIDNFNLYIPKYIYVLVKEIGMDQKNDLTSIYIVTNIEGFEDKKTVVEDVRIFFEHALALSAAYAVKLNVPKVVYKKDKTYSWAQQ